MVKDLDRNRKNFFNLGQNWSKLGIKCVKVDKALVFLLGKVMVLAYLAQR